MSESSLASIQTWLTAPMADLYQFDRPFPAGRTLVDATQALWTQR